MYWTTAKGGVLKIQEMTSDHLENCKKLLERNDVRINTLMKSCHNYSYTFLDEDDFRTIITYDYTNSLEYNSIVKELEYRSQSKRKKKSSNRELITCLTEYTDVSGKSGYYRRVGEYIEYDAPHPPSDINIVTSSMEFLLGRTRARVIGWNRGIQVSKEESK